MKVLSNLDFLKAFKSSQLSSSGKIASLDMGRKNIGVAISDSSRMFTFPHGVIKRKQFLPFNLSESAKDVSIKLNKFSIENQVIAYVVGLPLLMNDEHSSMCHEIMRFLNAIGESSRLIEENKNIPSQYQLPFMFCTLWDERQSSTLAKQLASQFTNNRSIQLKRKDEMAANIILQSFLEENKSFLCSTDHLKNNNSFTPSSSSSLSPCNQRLGRKRSNIQNPSSSSFLRNEFEFSNKSLF